MVGRISVGRRGVSKIEHGDLDSAKVCTIRIYLEAVGGGLAIEHVMGDQRVQVAWSETFASRGDVVEFRFSN